MVSIKRYLGNTGTETTLRQAVSLVIEKLGEYAVEGDVREANAFRNEMRAICEVLTPDLPPNNMLVLVESATQSLENYNKRITRSMGKQASDLQTLVRTVQDGLVRVAGDNIEAVEGLSRIGEEVEHSTGFKDLQSLKLYLGRCFTSLRLEMEREKTASRALISKLQIEIENLREAEQKQHQRAFEPGMETRPKDCMTAIRQAIERGTRHYAVVMVVNRVQPINARFGREAGDRMLTRFKEYVRGQLTPADELFRYTGPAMVAILERPDDFHNVRAVVRRMLDVPLEENYEVSGRSVLIPISAAWSVFMLSASAESTEKQIQTFIATQGCRDFA